MCGRLVSRRDAGGNKDIEELGQSSHGAVNPVKHIDLHSVAPSATSTHLHSPHRCPHNHMRKTTNTAADSSTINANWLLQSTAWAIYNVCPDT